MVFGDLDPHEMRDELEDPDGTTARTMTHDIRSVMASTAGRRRNTSSG